MKNNIKFIYFDVGGVALLDFSGTNKFDEMLTELGMDEDKKAKFWEIWNGLKNEVCTTYDVDQLIPIFRNELKLQIRENYSFLQDFVDRFEPNPSMITLVEKLKGKIKMGLLTGMYPRMLNLIMRTKDLLPNYNWDAIVDTSEVKFNKPSKELFEHAEKACGAKAEEILFIDNVEKNLIIPTGMGWKTFLYDPSEKERASIELNQVIETLSK